jgi:two-component system CheB/CheR fusion protein
VSSARSGHRGDDDRALRSFLASIRERGGIDFGTYKRGTIMRRLQRRMLATGTDDLRSYRRHVEANPDEYERLTSSFLIKVTEFFRDPELFDFLRDEVIPKLVAEAQAAKRELRVWSAGCATGEEAYSLAILIAEHLGEEAPAVDVRIFATDVDVDAIAFARRGVYAASVLAGVPEDLRARYFTPKGDRFEVSKRIRAMTVFGQHDLGQRAPFPRVDLALCRNVLIYFTQDLQRRALHLFAFALRDAGYLVLGKSESTSPLPEQFVVVNARLKTYRRAGDRVLIPAARNRQAPTVPRLSLPVARRAGWTDLPALSREQAKVVTLTERAEQLLLRLPVGVIVVDRRYDVQLLNLTARDLLGIRGQAVAEDLIHLLDDRLAPRVKSSIDAALRGKAAAPFVVEVASQSAEQDATRFVEIKAEPFAGGENRAPVDWVLVLATDVTASVGAANSLATSTERQSKERTRAVDQAKTLAGANEELRSVNRDLTVANAELRTANEELLVASEEVQAATEEVETLNEELQATNEELETMNEELQATVEELNTTNDDLESRSQELREVAATVEHERAAADLDRDHLLGIIDLIDEPVLVVDAAGRPIKANGPFRAAFGEPGILRLDAAMLRRATTEAFQAKVTLSGGEYMVRAQPLDGREDPTGALVFRPV